MLSTTKQRGIIQAKALPTEFVVKACMELPGIYETAIKLATPTLLFPLPSDIEDLPDTCSSCLTRGSCFASIRLIQQLREKEEELSLFMSMNKLGMLPELQSRIAVLKNLNYIDDQDLVTMKGRCCSNVCIIIPIEIIDYYYYDYDYS